MANPSGLPDFGDRRAEPTTHELSEGTAGLLREVDVALSSNRWAMLDTGSATVKLRLYEAASLRHCCLLLGELAQAAGSRAELTVRILGRCLVEAFLRALYLHYGGQDALVRLAQDTLHQHIKMHENIQDSNQRLVRDRRAARRRLAKVRATNRGIARRNAEQPSKAPLPLHPEPYVPRLAPSGLDLSATIAEFGALTPQALTVVETVDALTNLGPEKGFSNEDLAPMYHLYRGLSARGIHPSFAVYELYLLHGHFLRTAPDLGPPAMTNAEVPGGRCWQRRGAVQRGPG
ncbi:hypothetical protein ACFVXG_39365 [Kitasatospora sp. NPDC058162]|uniref:hypothetical protein n=1 Tax=Kitasatospora sp. NPDC058162 TaxID=3346362 RepID=UPI0036DF98FA